MKIHTLDSTILVPRPIAEVFSFFSDAFNLEILTPPWVKFRVLTPAPIPMAAGTRLHYKLGPRGIPVKWGSEITVWEPPHLFIDEQIRGPYRKWHHEHRFTARDGGTDVFDHVEYAVRCGALMNYWFVARDLRTIFKFRSEKLAELFASKQ